MRTPSISTSYYAYSDPPSDVKELPRYLREEVQKIASAILSLSEGHIDMVHVAPAKPRDGDIRLADGTDWDPGSGQGFYGYYGSAWHFLG